MDYLIAHPIEGLTEILTQAAVIPGIWCGLALEFCSHYLLFVAVGATVLSVVLKNFQRLKRFAAVPIFAAVLLGCLSFRFGEFEPEKWKANACSKYRPSDVRFWMADDLINRGMLIGKSDVEVERILGKPCHSTNVEPPTWCYVLRLEPVIYQVSLCVRFDQHGHVQKVEKGEFFSGDFDPGMGGCG